MGSAQRRSRRACRRRRRSRRSASRRRAGCRPRTPSRGSRGSSGTDGSRAPPRALGRARTRRGPSTTASSSSTRDHRRRRVAVAAQVGDQAPALGNGQQHRVEREQEAHQRADHREQRRRLVARRRCLREQPFVVARGLDVQAPGRQAHERRPHPGFHARARAARGCGETTVRKPVISCAKNSGATTIGLAAKPADLLFVQQLVQRRALAAAVHPQRHFPAELRHAETGWRAAPAGAPRRCRRTVPVRCGARASRRALSGSNRRRPAQPISLPFGPVASALASSSGAATRTPWMRRTCAKQARRHALRVAREQLQASPCR